MGRFIRFVAILVVVVVGVSLIALFAGRLPTGTDTGSLVVRGLVGLTIGLTLVFVVWRMLRSLTDAPPSAPPPIDARETEVVYVCSLCGTRLRLEVAATGKAPRHCGEEMESVLG